MKRHPFQKHPIRKSLFFLNIGIVVIAIACCVYVLSVGGTYALHTHAYYDESAFNGYDMTVDHEGVVEMTDCRLMDGEAVITLRSVGKGSVHVALTHRDSGPEYSGVIIQTDLRVTATGTIFEVGDTIFNFSGYEAVIMLLVLAMALIEGVMIYNFIRYRKKAQYSYQMIACGGVALFFFILILFILYKKFNNMVTSFSAFVNYVAETGENFLLAMMLPMLVLAVAVSVSNIWLLRHEGFRPVNALGIAASVVWITGIAVAFNFVSFDIRILPSGDVSHIIHTVLIYVLCYFTCMLLSTTLSAYLAAHDKPPYDRDYIIILGCAIRKDGTPTPLLRMRADSALDFEKAQEEATGRRAVFVPSGGQGSDEVISEAESMRRYLCEQGVPAEQIAVEDKSVNTYQNMKFSKEVIDRIADESSEQKIAFATTNYHVFRGYILARKNGFEARGISAKTKWYFFPNAFLREFVGLLVDRKFYHIAYILGFTLLFVVLRHFI